jgi:phytoene desaturase
MFSVVRALMGIAEKWGVKFRFNARADRIEVKDGRATGVALRGGELLEADAVIANADLPYVYSSLLPKNGSAARMERKRYSCSTINFYWGVDKRYPGLTPHTLFLGRDYKETFESIIVDLSLSDDPAFYLHAPVGVDPALAPEGEDTLIAMVPVGHLSERSEQDWDEIKKRAREAVLRRLGRIGMGDLEEHLKFEICYTPINWRSRFNLVKGATHGLSHTLGQMFYFRPRNRHRLYRNLYFVGASTHPGTGIPCVLISARLAAERITEDIKVVV